MPEPAALSPRWAGAPGWGADYRLSGYAAIAWSLLFDKKGKVFASGPPQLGAIWRGQRAWDQLLDATFAGGAGAHRWAPPSNNAANDAARATWTYNQRLGLQGLRYVLAAWHRDPRVAGSTYQKVAGIGLPIDGVIVEEFVHVANVCDANAWKVGGVIFELVTVSTSTRWQNLKDILAAGGAEPCFRGGRLGLKISAPRIALDTITREDNLVQWGDQSAQLCAYELVDRRELGEIELVVKPRLRRYG